MDQLNERFGEVEKRLQRYGVSAVVPFSDDQEFHANEAGYLGFEKHGSRWRLLYILEEVGFGDRRLKEEPLVSAPRWVRLAAATLLPELVETVKASAAREAAQVREAVDAVNDVLRTLPLDIVAESGLDDDLPF
ncbi:MAG: hypothetical protein R3B40_20055 [Polyangiales bacterium]